MTAVIPSCEDCIAPNDNKMSDGGRDRASPAAWECGSHLKM